VHISAAAEARNLSSQLLNGPQRCGQPSLLGMQDHDRSHCWIAEAMSRRLEAAGLRRVPNLPSFMQYAVARRFARVVGTGMPR
jgi:hypothetical protein